MCMKEGGRMLIISDMIRGHTDSLILAQLLKGDSYGYLINKTIATITQGGFEFKEATLYTVFRRLEKGGYISSYWGDENQGARRRYYTITEKGKKLYYENKKDWESIKQLLDQLLEG